MHEVGAQKCILTIFRLVAFYYLGFYFFVVLFLFQNFFKHILAVRIGIQNQDFKITYSSYSFYQVKSCENAAMCNSAWNI